MSNKQPNWDELQRLLVEHEQRLRFLRRMLLILAGAVGLLALALLFPAFQDVLKAVIGVPLFLLLVLVPLLLYMAFVIWACEKIFGTRPAEVDERAEGRGR